LEVTQTTELFDRREIAVRVRRPYRSAPELDPTKSSKQGGKAMSSSRTVVANDIELFLREQGKGPLVVLCHGWPELSYSWRHQVGAIADAGFHVVAPDMRGFGRSSAPADIAAYSIFDTVGDMVALVAALGETQAIIVGHDWGAPVAWHAALFRPDIFTAVAGLSVPPPFRGRGRPLQMLRENGVTNFYWQYFQTQGVAEAEFERDVALTMRSVLAGRRLSDPTVGLLIQDGKGFLDNVSVDQPLPGWLGEDDLTVFVEALQNHRFPRRAELVSQHRSQLGAHRALAGRADPPAFSVHCGREGSRDHGPDRRQARQRARARAAEAEAQAHHRRRRPLDPAGAARRGQRGPDRLHQGRRRSISIKPAGVQDLARSARNDRRIGRLGVGRRGIARVILMGDGTRIIGNPYARTDPARGRHLRRR
jgi:epoxide hydrolase A/B